MMMMCRPICIVISLLMIGALHTGCAQKARKVSVGYQTVAERAEQDTEQARHLNAQAIELTLAGEYEKAEQAAKQALTYDVEFGPAHNTLGRVYFHQERFYLAAWEFQYAARLMPNHPEPRNNLGLVLEHVGKYEQALGEYDRALAMEPDNVEIIANAARTRVRRGETGQPLRQLLEELIMKDTRPQWRQWARQKLAFMGAFIPDAPR